MTVGERIRRRRQQLKLSADKLGELIGKDRSTIYRYEGGEIENMPIGIISKLAEVLHTTPTYLMGWDEENLFSTKVSTYPFYPICISAGLPNPVEAITKNDVSEITINDEVMGKWANHSDIFIMRVNGESLNKIIPHGSLIAVKQVSPENLKNGDIVVYSDGHDYAVKRYYRDNTRIIFRPDSNDPSFYDYVTDIYNENLVIHGKVVLYIVELD